MSTHRHGIEELITAVAAPGELPGAGDGLTQVVQTHISAVFLTREHAFKLKKPVDFGFLDFSTAEKRQHFCREELRLNRRLASDVYLGLSTITREADGSLALDGRGEVVDWLVRMRRLPDGQTLDRLIAAGTLAADQVEEVAGVLARFYADAERGHLTAGERRICLDKTVSEDKNGGD